ncbi:MAG: thiol-disulfide oxidoreductase DCC family protein [Planctomycetota bacterium]
MNQNILVSHSPKQPLHSTSADNSVPTDGIVFFDGVCGFCNHFVNWVIRHDRRRQLRFSPLQGQTARQLLPADRWQQLSTVVLLTPRHAWIRSAAVCRILWAMGGPWKILAAMLWVIPLPLRDLGYRLVGQVRYQLFGRHDQCRLPSAEERALFLD